MDQRWLLVFALLISVASLTAAASPIRELDDMEQGLLWKTQSNAKVAPENEIVASGARSVKMEFTGAVNPSWSGIYRTGLNLPLADKLSLWIYPVEKPRLYIRIDDNDETRVEWNLSSADLKTGQWNYVELKLSEGRIWGKNKQLKNINYLLLCGYTGWQEFSQPQDYTFYFDDVRFINGTISELKPAPGSQVSGFIHLPLEKTVFTDHEELPFHLYLKGTDTVNVLMQLAEQEKQEQISLTGQEKTIAFSCKTDQLTTGSHALNVTIAAGDGKQLAIGEFGLTKVSKQELLSQLDELSGQLPSFASCLSEAKENGLDIAYPLSIYTIIENFIAYTKEDLNNNKLVRAYETVAYLVDAMDRGKAMAKRLLAERDPSLIVPRYQTGPIEIEDGTFKQAGVPRYFVGMGHFGQVRKDIPLFPNYGFNIIQIEQGPTGVVLPDGSVNKRPIEALLKVLDNAALHNVKVNLLLSPHYMPQWAFEQNPELGKEGMGFIKYKINHPVARKIIETYLRTLVPMVGNHPALHSYTLSNEPQYTGKTEQSRQDFADWLQKRHGGIQQLNNAWGSSYQSFAEITIPADGQNRPLWYEWCVFNQERFTEFHAWMAGIIKEYHPEIPVHSKVMADLFGSPANFANGIDHAAMTKLGSISGNDCGVGYPGSNDYAQGWLKQIMYYTFQRSVAPGQPVFNSENHLITNNSERFYPNEHIYTALWDGFIHGLGATTIWVWERNEANTDLKNNILTRPNCVEAAAKATLDLNRLGEYVSKFQRQPAEVALLYSPSAAAWPEYQAEVQKLFEAAFFQDVPVSFVTEEQLQQDQLDKLKIVLLPAVTHLTNTAIEAIKRFVDQGGTVFAVAPTGTFDEYSKRRDLGYLWGARVGPVETISQPLALTCFAEDIFVQKQPRLSGHNFVQRLAPTTATVLAAGERFPLLLLNSWGEGKIYYLATSLTSEDYYKLFSQLFVRCGLNRTLSLVDTEGNRPFGVELRAYKEDKLYANIVNYTKEALELTLTGPEMKEIKELITGRAIAQKFVLYPLQPVLIEIKLTN